MGNTTASLLKRKPVAQSRVKPVIQAKLAVGPVNDHYEGEANRVADSVVNGRPLSVVKSPPIISGLNAQRVAAPISAGPEQKEEELAAPEERAQRSHRGSGPETPTKKPPDLKGIDDPKTADKMVQTVRNADSGIPGLNGGVASDEVEVSIQRMRGRPAPGLDPEMRTKMETGTGLDFGGARVHTDSAAGEATDALGARAFTVGQDMFFAQGQFNPKTTAGQHLIAHELTHTVQQNGGSAAAQRIQRAGAAEGKSTVEPDEEEGSTFISKKFKGAKIDTVGENGIGVITIPSFYLPEVGGGLKGSLAADNVPRADAGRELPQVGKPFRLTGVPKRPPGEAYKEWTEYARTHWSKGLMGKLAEHLKSQKDAAPVTIGDQQIYYLKRKKAKAKEQSGKILIGTVGQLAESDGLLRPKLSHTGSEASLDADHILELQVGGMDDPSNMWLLDSKYNRRIGSSIRGQMDKDLKKVIDEARSDDIVPNSKLPKDVTAAKRNWIKQYSSVKKGKFGRSTKNHWSKRQIKAGEHLTNLAALTVKELVDLGFKFDPDKQPKYINVFTSKSGGAFRRFTVSKDKKSLIPPKAPFFTGVVVTSATYTPLTSADQGGVISEMKATLTQFKKKGKGKNKKPFLSREKPDFPLEVRHDPLLGFGGYVNRPTLKKALEGIEFKALSPITFSNVAFTDDGALSAIGTIGSTKKLLPDLQIPILLSGSDIFIRFPVPTENLNLGPVAITEAALDLGFGEGGFFIQGSAGIAVDQIGNGSLAARAEAGDVILAGEFNLELDFLDPATIKMKYSLQKDDFQAEAKLGVKKGTLPGVQSGEVTVKINRESVGVVGSLALGGILAGSVITIGYTPETGLIVEGKDLPLPIDKLPGVSNAKVTVKAVRNPETGTWLISGGGKASLGIAGASGTLDILFDGEAVIFKGRADVAKGPAKGWLDVSATNRAIDDEGNPIENGPVGDLKIWGKGEASITFGKILTGTAGLEYTPDGRVIISGEIALPPTFDLFEKKEFKKTLLEVNPPDFPIWGVKLGPVGIGIFAFVDAEIRFLAFIGPGQLRDTKVTATLDLEKPEEAVVEGNALLFVPSYAGLTLDVGGGLKAQVANAYVKGRVGLDGTLGLAVDISLAVNINWNQNEGLEAGAEADITGRPKFEVGVNASVTAGVDLWLTEIEKTWGPWRKKLGEFGPDMELGATMPINWSEKKGLDLSLDNIKIKKPKFDAKAIMKDAFDTLV